MCQALIHHKIAFPTPSSWFPGVPTTLDGGVRLRPTHARKIGKGRAMLFCKLDDGFSCIISIIATADTAFNRFQFEARGPIASGEQRCIVCMETGTVYIAAVWGESLWKYPGAPKGHKLAGTARYTWRSIWHKSFCSYSTDHTARSRHFKSLFAVRHV